MCGIGKLRPSTAMSMVIICALLLFSSSVCAQQSNLQHKTMMIRKKVRRRVRRPRGWNGGGEGIDDCVEEADGYNEQDDVYDMDIAKVHNVAKEDVTAPTDASQCWEVRQLCISTET